MSLADKCILVTRHREQAGEFVAEIEARGGIAVVFPLIAIVDPPSWDGSDSAIAAIDTYDSVVFSSTNGVDKFFGRCKEKGVDPANLHRLAAYVVGEKTRHAVESYGVQVEYNPDDFSSEALGRYLSSLSLEGRRFLIVRGDLGKDDLDRVVRDRGAVVTAIVAYRTVTPHNTMTEDIGERLAGGEIDVLTFTSPSSVNRFRELYPDFSNVQNNKRVIIGVIGPTTRSAASDAGMTPDVVAPHATVVSLVQALDDFFTKNV